MPETWKHIIVGPTHAKKYPKIPRRISLFMTGESTNALKLFMLFEDSAGVEHKILAAVQTGGYVGGRTLQFSITGPHGVSGNTPGVLEPTKVEPPIKLKGLLFVCRKPLRNTILYFDNIRFDDVMIENFERNTEWHVIDRESRKSRINLRVSRQPIPGRSMEGLAIKTPFPNREDCLTDNSNLENDEDGDNMPDSWVSAKKNQYLPRDSTGKPLLDPAHLKGKIHWERIGAESKRSLSINVKGPESWAAVATLLKDVKPNTDYTVSLWYRQKRPNDLVLMAFGTKLRIVRHFELNSEHWIRFSGIFSSGHFSGDCVLALGVANPPVPTKVYVDKIEVYKGVSPIGYNRARMQHYYYSFAEISPDIPSYVPFAYECLFEKNKRPPEIHYVLELPADVSLETSAAWYMRRWHTWFTWRRNAPYRTTRKEFVRNRTRYVRHTISLPAWKTTDERDLVNYVVPVGVRDGWRGTVGTYSGLVNLAFVLSTELREGTRKAYYYAKWDGGQQESQELELRVVRVPEVKHRFKRMVSLVSTDAFNSKQFPSLANIFKHIGANGLAGGSRKAWGPGMKYYASWVNFPMYESSDPDAFAMKPNGKRDIGKAARCMSYRGPDWDKYMKTLFKKIDEGYNVFMFDDARPATCYDNKNKAEFANMLKEHTNLPYIDPAEFIAPGWSGPKEYRRLWHDFQLWIYGVTAQEMKDELLAYARKRDKNAHIYFLQSARPVKPIHSFANAQAQKAFDFGGMQAYLYCYHGTYQGSPKKIGDQLRLHQENLRKFANSMVPTLGPGLTYMHPVSSLDPYAQMKYQILEAAMAHKFLGYNMYAGVDIDLGDLRYMAEANELLARFEDLFIDGEVVEGIKVSKKNVSAKVKKLGEHFLLLAGDYSTYQHQSTSIKVTLPDILPDTFTDVETGEQFTITTKDNRLEINFSDHRARLLYAGPGWQSQ